MTRKNLEGRLTALETTGQSGCYVVRVPPGADRATIDAEIAAHKARTGYRGLVVVAPFRPDSVQEWLKTYAPPGSDR
ncbi:hypothetical protein GXW78_20160 [Roseomonas terrae]|jgi:hypothetical protein|uniref:SPOR domain-containing protein n=1 Tax=Neoroseomonas terrae TaxID=424799 RepID=A0ABS5ELT1_9PROT|nr:hypothetical protein [Neoroseomonas terrae]MBR0651990.1 hypothetical protein [Neoroseomonas terrae]